MDRVLLAGLILLAVSGSKAENDKKLAQAAADYEMTIDVVTSTTLQSGVKCEPMTSSHSVIALPIFLPELTRYPKDFFKGAGINRMILCGKLSRDGKPLGGLAIGNGAFYVSLNHANVNPSHTQRTFHHEVFHLIDEVPEKEWGKITAPGAFITDYARTNSIEDRAELFSEMMVDRKGVAARAASNAGIKQKQQLLDGWVKQNHPTLYPQLGK